MAKTTTAFQTHDITNEGMRGRPSHPKPVSYRRERIISRGVELGDDVLWRVLRRPHAEPDRRIETRQAGFVRRRHVGQTGKPSLGRDGYRPDGAGLHLSREIGRRLDHHIDLAGHHVLHRRTVAAIRYELERGSGHILE